MHLFMLITIFSGNHGAPFAVVWCDVPFRQTCPSGRCPLWQFPRVLQPVAVFLEVELYLCVPVSPRWPPCQCMPAWAVMQLPSEMPS